MQIEFIGNSNFELPLDNKSVDLITIGIYIYIYPNIKSFKILALISILYKLSID